MPFTLFKNDSQKLLPAEPLDVDSTDGALKIRCFVFQA